MVGAVSRIAPPRSRPNIRRVRCGMSLVAYCLRIKNHAGIPRQFLPVPHHTARRIVDIPTGDHPELVVGVMAPALSEPQGKL